MTQLMIHHTVRDYAAWRPAFDRHEAARQAAGLTHGEVFQRPEDPNDLIVLMDVGDPAKARKFASSEDLREVMRAAGVIGEPTVSFVE